MIMVSPLKYALLATGLVMTSALTAAPASAKTAMCVVSSLKAKYSGPCSFTPGPRGSFTVSALETRYMLPRVAAVSVAVDEYDYAKVRAVMATGVELPWGDARRSKSDRACWIGEDFRVCAY
jgi:hypothetical protein